MEITYNYTIDSAITIKNDQHTGLNNIIDLIRFTITATHEDGRVESIKSQIGLNFEKEIISTDDNGVNTYGLVIDSENFTPIEDVTQEMIKTWLLELLVNNDENGQPRNAMEELLAERFEPSESAFGEIVFEAPAEADDPVA